MTFESNELESLDGRGYTVLDAITHAGFSSSSSHANPSKFICVDGKTYWLKGNAQQGLVAELIAGRLAAKVGAGPGARIIRVTRQALPPGGAADHLEGVVVGSEDRPDTVNGRDLQPFISNSQFQPGLIDAPSRALVIAFQSWLGMGDAQVLVHLARGLVMSLDHGDCFGATAPNSDPAVVITDIPGVTAEVGRNAANVIPAVERIEAIADKDILEAVSGIPGGDQWRSPSDRRLEVARWITYRRQRLREVMEAWMTT